MTAPQASRRRIESVLVTALGKGLRIACISRYLYRRSVRTAVAQALLRAASIERPEIKSRLTQLRMLSCRLLTPLMRETSNRGELR